MFDYCPLLYFSLVLQIFGSPFLAELEFMYVRS
jgi:hypothetical protein